MIATSTAMNVILVVGAVALVALWVLIKRAPEGYQDRDGFHYGPPEKPPEDLMLDELALRDEIDQIDRTGRAATRPAPTTKEPSPRWPT